MMLAVPVVRKRFIDRDKLRQYLKLQQGNTELIPICGPEDLLLSDMLVQCRFRMRDKFFKDLARQLSPGLRDAFVLLSGLETHGAVKEAEVDPTMVARWFNDVLRLRFSRIKGHYLVVDHLLHTVDGIVGPAQFNMHNLALLDTTEDILARHSQVYNFAEACVAGRELLLCYRQRKEYTRHKNVDYYRGICVSNREGKGMTMRVASSIGWAGKYPGDAITQVVNPPPVCGMAGPAQEKFSKCLAKAESLLPRRDVVSRRLQALSSTPLGVGGSEVEHKQRLKQLKNKLRYKLLDRSVVSKIIHQAVWGFGPQSVGQRASQKQLISRTLLNLFTALCYHARSLDVEPRQRCEVLALRLLEGKAKF